MRDLKLTFVTRVGCHLCDHARPVVLEAARRAGAVVEEVDVDRDDHLLANYGMRIPVLLGPEDEVLAEGVIDDRKALRRLLKRL